MSKVIEISHNTQDNVESTDMVHSGKAMASFNLPEDGVSKSYRAEAI
jgi:hypothetical protein